MCDVPGGLRRQPAPAVRSGQCAPCGRRVPAADICCSLTCNQHSTAQRSTALSLSRFTFPLARASAPPPSLPPPARSGPLDNVWPLSQGCMQAGLGNH